MYVDIYKPNETCKKTIKSLTLNKETLGFDFKSFNGVALFNISRKCIPDSWTLVAKRFFCYTKVYIWYIDIVYISGSSRSIRHIK